MTGKLDLYKAYYDASWTNPPASFVEANMKYLADDFRQIDAEGKVTGDRATWIGMGQMLMSSFTDFKSVIADMQEAEDGVIVTSHFEGTHTGDLDLSMLGAGVVKASGKRIVWPETTNKFMIEGGKITGIKSIAGGGISGFMEALGVKLPSAS